MQFKDYLQEDIRDVRDLQRFLASLREQIKRNNSLVYKQKKQQSEWFAQEKQNQEYIADDINFFVKRNGIRSQNARRKRHATETGGPAEDTLATVRTNDSDVYGLQDKKVSAY